jgi:hypothetical protein
MKQDHRCSRDCAAPPSSARAAARGSSGTRTMVDRLVRGAALVHVAPFG